MDFRTKKIFPKIHHHLPKPQLQFKDVDNYKQFIPKLKHKPHASISPLSLKLCDDKEYCHPYQDELQAFVPDLVHVNDTSVWHPKSLNQVPLIYVEDENKLHSLLADLSVHPVIGVDLEVCV